MHVLRFQPCFYFLNIVASVYLLNKVSRTLKMHDLPFNKGVNKGLIHIKWIFENLMIS